MTEDLDFNIMENPYHGDSVELADQSIGENGSIHENNKTETITATTNIYYDMDDMDISERQTSVVTAIQNIYYEL